MSLEQTIDNLQIRNANMVTFVGTSNTMVDTTTGRIQTKGIQHNSNVITDVSGPHGRGVATLKKYPEIVFDASKYDHNHSTNTYTQAGYTVTGSSQATDEKNVANLYNEQFPIIIDNDDGWQSANNTYDSSGVALSVDTLTGITGSPSSRDGSYTTLELPHKIKLSHIQIHTRNSVDHGIPTHPKQVYVYGSNDGSSWTQVGSHIFTSVPATAIWQKIDINSTTPYNYFILQATSILPYLTTNLNRVYILDLEWYGYEEDPPAGDHSVDTSFKSRFNNPQTTGVQVLVDGATGVGTNQISGGPDPSGNQSTYVTDGKYWTLNGTLTSNLSVEANTFLEGDQPHAVSVWFNSSNLEANVSNTCVFSIASEEKLDSVNLDLQSNTWHNLTYSYQGEGGSRVTYLDGRKVSEDQAEDTFGEYPPFNMTGYSQDGYVVSASSEYGTSYLAHEAFNGTFADNGDCWLCANSLYDSSTGNYNGNANLGSDSGGPAFANADKGEWLKLEMPNKFVLDYITICGSTATGVNPKDWKIYGSNDGKNWDVLLSKTNAIIAAYNATSGKEHVVGASKAYKYFALVVTKSGGLSGNHYIHVAELEFYGHRENDLVRLPDPTNVLKYPHIAMTGPAQRGYVVTASSTAVYATDLAPKNAFNGIISPSSATASWQSIENGYNSTGAYNYKASSPHTSSLSTSTTQYNGEWLSLETPHKIKIQSYKLYINSDVSNYRADSIVLLGSDTTTNGSWNLLHTETSATYTNDVYTATVNSNTSYKYHRLLFESLTGNGGEVYINELEFYGTGVDSIPIQIGGGNIDKVANFRVYDRFIEEDQVNEIWNAQKEEFGRAKPQMVLQQGKLGIGTDAPQGSLSVADEPHNLEEFPPRAMTGEETYMEGHGVFKVALSSADNGNNKWTAFNKRGFTGVDDDDYLEWGSAQYTAATGVYTGSVSTQGVSGEWLEIEMPYKIKLEYNLLYHRTRDGMITNDYWVLERMPRDGAILGSNDGETWTTLQSWTDFDWVTGTSATGQRQSEYWRTPGKFVTNSTAYYKTFRLVFSKLFGANGDRPNIGEWRLFGTREQGQSVLHDGQLTLTKNLDVPRIGPPLDADDTPRRDRLVVEYNTSSNPTFEGAVRDTSGRGNDGVFYGDVSYDANEKALEFPGSDDFIFTHVQNILGAWKHSVSFWVKYDNTSTGMVFMMTKTGNTSGQANGSIGFSIAGGAFRYFFWGDDTDWNYSIQPGTLYHIVLTYDGGTANTSRKLYINGVDQGSPDARTSGQSGALDLETTTSQMKIGCGINNNEDLDGSVSNFKFYDCTLSAEEVKTLYDMGRNGSVANPQPLHIAAPLYAPGTIVQVEQSIKRDDSSTASTSASDIPGLSVTIHPKFGTSKILVSYQVNMGGNYHMFLRVKRTQNGTTTYVGNGNASGNRPLASSYQSHLHAAHVNSMNMEILDPANGTDPITYQIQFWVAHTNYAAWINRGTDNYNNIYGPAAQSSSITVKEVCQ